MDQPLGREKASLTCLLLLLLPQRDGPGDQYSAGQRACVLYQIKQSNGIWATLFWGFCDSFLQTGSKGRLKSESAMKRTRLQCFEARVIHVTPVYAC